jgi:hypothetical protein
MRLVVTFLAVLSLHSTCFAEDKSKTFQGFKVGDFVIIEYAEYGDQDGDHAKKQIKNKDGFGPLTVYNMYWGRIDKINKTQCGRLKLKEFYSLVMERGDFREKLEHMASNLDMVHEESQMPIKNCLTIRGRNNLMRASYFLKENLIIKINEWKKDVNPPRPDLDDYILRRQSWGIPVECPEKEQMSDYLKQREIDLQNAK